MLIRFFHNHTPTTINTTPTRPTKVVSNKAAPSDWPHVDTPNAMIPPLIMTTAATFLTRSIRLDPIQHSEVMHPCPPEPASTLMANRPSDDPRYHTARWRTTRARVISRGGRRCARPDCTSDMSLPGETHVDHIDPLPPHASDAEFYNEDNLWVLCKRHHFSKSLDDAAGSSQPQSPNA